MVGIGPKPLDMTFVGLWKMCKGYYAELALMSMGGQAEDFACPDLRARSPIAVSGNLYHCSAWPKPNQKPKIGFNTQ